MDDRDVFQMEIDVARLAYQIRVQSMKEKVNTMDGNGPSSVETRNQVAKRVRFGFEGRFVAVPRADDAVERKILALKDKLNSLCISQMGRSINNLCAEERNALLSLKRATENKAFRISVSDKAVNSS
ncbi:hypothetical protein ACOME3_003246 [Neoechinorhynchus agilis]